MRKLGERRRWRDVADCKSVGYALVGSNPTSLTILYLVVLILVSIKLVSCSSPTVRYTGPTDTRTAGYPSDVMYPWLVGGKSKTKKYNNDDIKYIAPVCGQCER